MVSSFKQNVFFFLLAGCASAVILPTAPVAGDVFDTGKPCPIRWKPDTTDKWTNFTIGEYKLAIYQDTYITNHNADLMSGSNKDMLFVDNVATQLDGTIGSPIPYAWSCPDVDSHSPIYLYAFSNNNNGTSSDIIYSPRFTIASVTGESGPAEYPSQPDGQPTPWGVGHIIKHSPAPDPPPASAPPANAVAPSAKPPAMPGTIFNTRRREPVTICTKRYCRYAKI